MLTADGPVGRCIHSTFRLTFAPGGKSLVCRQMSALKDIPFAASSAQRLPISKSPPRKNGVTGISLNPGASGPLALCQACPSPLPTSTSWPFKTRIAQSSRESAHASELQVSGSNVVIFPELSIPNWQPKMSSAKKTTSSGMSGRNSARHPFASFQSLSMKPVFVRPLGNTCNDESKAKKPSDNVNKGFNFGGQIDDAVPTPSPKGADAFETRLLKAFIYFTTIFTLPPGGTPRHCTPVRLSLHDDFHIMNVR